MMVVLIDKGDANWRFGKSAGGFEPRKASANNNDMGLLFSIHVFLCVVVRFILFVKFITIIITKTILFVNNFTIGC